MRIRLETTRAKVKSCHRTVPWMPWALLKARQKKMTGRLKLSQWPKWPLTMSHPQHLKLKAWSQSQRRAVKARLLRARQRLPRRKLRPQQRKTLNKNKLNKIIKLRIEFKFERVGLDHLTGWGASSPPGEPNRRKPTQLRANVLY